MAADGMQSKELVLALSLFSLFRLFRRALFVGILSSLPVVLWAQTSGLVNVDQGRYVPTIWVDPDGCEHWVMDDGAEGYMTPHTNRQGIPVCRGGRVCGVLSSDQFFATNSATVSASGRERLRQFFSSNKAVSYVVTGHTDSRASDAYNMRLSLRRANAVAKIGNALGANISDVRGYGERQPATSNASAAGMAKNRRVEIMCIK